MNSKFRPALIGGAALGAVLVLIALLQVAAPAVGTAAGCFVCLVPFGAGLLAVYLYVKGSTVPAQIGDGAVLGALAGFIGGLIYLIIGVPLSYAMNSTAVEAQMAQLSEQGITLPFSGLALLFVAGIIGVVIYTILSLIGGLIGVAIFEKRKGGDINQPPPPPYDNQGGMNTPPNAPPTNYGAPGQPGI